MWQVQHQFQCCSVSCVTTDPVTTDLFHENYFFLKTEKDIFFGTIDLSVPGISYDITH